MSSTGPVLVIARLFTVRFADSVDFGYSLKRLARLNS